jgi:hypothetical protein
VVRNNWINAKLTRFSAQDSCDMVLAKAVLGGLHPEYFLLDIRA